MTTTPLPISADDVAVVTMPSADADSVTYNCDIPDWLQQCLDEAEQPDLSIDPDRQLIRTAFQFAYDLHGE
jgi:GTP diphosphokinase / guanosine-3',5'-bis(diphosphate) 3'-diphosphatase